MWLNKLNKIGRYVKYDGKPPMSDEEIIELTLIEHEKEQVVLRADLIRVRREKERIKSNELMLEKDLQRVQDKLDTEEKKYEGLIDYYDQMTAPCPHCGDDIMDKDGKCSSLSCGKRQSAHVRAWQYQERSPYYNSKWITGVME